MCGIAGAYRAHDTTTSTKFHEALLASLNSVAHRGPDGFGFWRNGAAEPLLFHPQVSPSEVSAKTLAYFAREAAPVRMQQPAAFFGHRRLSIIDVTENGAQPMGLSSRMAREPDLWVTYNGEIYNYLELRETLKTKGYQFKTESDTEVLLRAYEEWGIDCFAEFNGMWAMAIWDGRKQQLILSRDRMGVKPLYYTFADGHLVFGSEIKQLLELRSRLGIENRWNAFRMYEFLALNQQHHSEDALYEGIYQLPGAHVMTLSPMDKVDIKTVRAKTRAYWSFPNEFQVQSFDAPSFEEAAKHLRELFLSSVALRLRSDVAVGSALSGGLDSSGVVAAVSQLDPLEQKTFSAIYDGPESATMPHINEQRFAQKVIDGRKIQAHWVRPDGEGLLESFKRLVRVQDGPFTTTAVYPQWMVFQSARQNGVTVMLDGQGSDEIMGGYEGFLKSHLKSAIRQEGILKAALGGARFLKNHPHYFTLSRFTNQFAKKSEKLKLFSKAAQTEILERKAAIETQGDAMRLGNMDRVYSDPFREALYRATVCSSLPALLAYEDKNSMDASIESRTPFLDYRIVEFVFKCPSSFHIRDGSRKALLREAFKGLIPEEVRTRKDKLGFSTPEPVWRAKALERFNVAKLDFDSRYFDQAAMAEFAESPGLWKALGIAYSKGNNNG
jgi:asparagine synthase (glutamine-hydrolysing)